MKKALIVLVTVLMTVTLFISCGNDPFFHYVEFDSNGGTAVERQVVRNGEKATEPKDPTKDGTEFVAWYDGENVFDFEHTEITKDYKLTAKWSTDGSGSNPGESGGSGNTPAEKAISYDSLVGTWIYGDKLTGTDLEYISLVFNADNTVSLAEGKGNGIHEYSDTADVTVSGSTITITYGDDVWSYTAEIKDGNLVLKQVGDATWLEYFDFKEITLDRYYTVSFNSNGGSRVDSKTFKAGAKITGVTEPTKGGFDFGGWKKGDADFNLETDTVNEDMTLVAKWNYKKAYEVGDSGPAGGTIFYVATSPVTTTYKDSAGNDVTYTWKYLEVAPIPTQQVKLIFGYSLSTSSAAIGAGHANTRAIVNALGTAGDNYAALECDNYTKTQDGVVYDDWFLPSESEFDALFAAKERVSGFTTGYVDYWTSTEISSSMAKYGRNTYEGCSQASKIATRNAVLPIRAF